MKRPKDTQDVLIRYLANISAISTSLSLLLFYILGAYALDFITPPGFNVDQFADRLIAAAGILRGFVMMGIPLVMFAMMAVWFFVALCVGVYVQALMLFIFIRMYLKKDYSVTDVINAYTRLASGQEAHSGAVMIFVANRLKRFSYMQRLINWDMRLTSKVIQAGYK